MLLSPPLQAYPKVSFQRCLDPALWAYTLRHPPNFVGFLALWAFTLRHPPNFAGSLLRVYYAIIDRLREDLIIKIIAEKIIHNSMTNEYILNVSDNWESLQT